MFGRKRPASFIMATGRVIHSSTTFRLSSLSYLLVYPGGRLGLWPLACWDCGFEFRREHGCLSLECVCVYCQVEVSAPV